MRHRAPGKRDTTYAIKYVDADGRQCWEPVGKASQGMTRRDAERKLGAKLGAVEKGLRKPPRRTFDELADEFDTVVLAAKPRKKST